MYRKKKRFDNKKIIVIVILVVALITGLFVNVVKTNRELSVFEQAIKDSVMTVSNVFKYPFDFINKKSMQAKEKKEMYEKYKDMEYEIDNSKKIESENEELQYQIEQLKKVLELNQLMNEYDLVNASVIGRDLNLWNETITINKGSESNIEIGMPVVVNEGLIGKVIKVSSYTSTVRLLTATTNDKISVKINTNGEYIYGILTNYNSKTKTYIIEGIAQNVKFEENTDVVTTGMGDIYPSGIKIGKVIGINTDNFDLANVLEIQPAVDFDNISYVSVLLRKAR